MIVSFGFFGVVVRTRSPYIAPRCTARPRDVIYNPSPSSKAQKRGSPMFGWIPWCNELSYDQLLRGVPGTGTRQGGLQGALLKVNLDGIVLLRFHALCMRITLVATFLCLVIILPLNLSARCWNFSNTDAQNCNIATYNLTNYERTTLANIPSLAAATQAPSTILGRLYGIVLCSWLICLYACMAIQQEWIEMLALRRVYYLEYNHWRERKRELQQTLLKEFEGANNASASGSAHKIAEQVPKKRDDPVRHRDPWIPHPEQRDTVPNIALYSVLVGGLPAAPSFEINEDDVEAAINASRRQNIDWQLTFAGEYFDRCVPNQPGYSSSIAAITILPSASDLARAWGRWYSAAAKLRKLRYIRGLIRDRVHYDISEDNDEQDEDEDDDDDREFELPGAITDPTKNRTLTFSSGRSSSGREGSTLSRRPSTGEKSKAKPPRRSHSEERVTSGIYDLSAENKGYYRDVLGASFDGDVDQSNLFISFEFGPEQTAVYSREFAQSAAACCPHGMFEGRIARMRIDDLRELEEDAKEEVHTANLLLRQAQKHAIINPQNMEAPIADCAAACHERSTLEMSMEPYESYRAFHLSNSVSIRALKSKTIKPKKTTSRYWELVNKIVNDPANTTLMSRLMKQGKADTGVVHAPTFKEYFGQNEGKTEHSGSSEFLTDSKGFAGKNIIDALSRETTYAIVTFTSRQAACAARQCLADGRALDRWTTYEEIPISPLADAAPFALCPCRGCCRPVTISLNDKQKLVRYYFSLLLLGSIYVFYTIPLTFATSLIDASKLNELIPGYEEWVQKSVIINNIFSGILPALIWTTFFALCPTMFKTIANFGSNAHSVYKAEFKAMQYYWWFLILTAFTGNSLANMVIQGFNAGLSIGAEATKVLANVAATIPTIISATWLNWIIVRSTITLPLQYLIQMNSFLFTFLGWKCCSRINRGGGPGGPVPYRIYLDSGVVFLCAVALGPAAPLVTPFAFMYFLFCWPLMRRNLIFVYRPNYDAGGGHWPFLFEILISSMFTAMILLSTMMALKKAVGPAVFAVLPFVPVFFFRIIMHRRFLKSYVDTSLYTSSSLDGWDNHVPTSVDRREEFRRFLVDAHKAAYVPVCLASSAEVLTIEPAIVVPSELDTDLTRRDTSPRNSLIAKAMGMASVSQGEKVGFNVSPRLESQPSQPKQRFRRSKSDESNDQRVPTVPPPTSFSRVGGKSSLKSAQSMGPSKSRASSTSTNSQHLGRSIAHTENQFGVSLRRIPVHYQSQISVHDDGSVSSSYYQPLTASASFGLLQSQSCEMSDDE